MLKNNPKTRNALYLLAVVAAVVAPVVAVTSPEYGAAITTASGVLMAAAGVTAASNITGPESANDVLVDGATFVSDPVVEPDDGAEPDEVGYEPGEAQGRYAA